MRHTIKVISLGLISMMMAHAALAKETSHDMSSMKMDNMGSMENMDKGMKKQAYNGSGVIKQIDNEQHKISIAHGAIPAISWPAMTMTFVYSPVAEQVKTLKPGEAVDFSFVQQGNDYVLQSINAK